MRDLWKTTNITYGAKLGYARTPVKLKSSGIRSLIAKDLFQQNVRPVLQEGQKRHEFKTAHGFRKFFKTQAEQYMKAVNVEMLMGHDLGISKSYYKPQEILVMVFICTFLDYQQEMLPKRCRFCILSKEVMFQSGNGCRNTNQ